MLLDHPEGCAVQGEANMPDDRLIIGRSEIRPSKAAGFVPHGTEAAEVLNGQLGQ
jgi:hypothetical protein